MISILVSLRATHLPPQNNRKNRWRPVRKGMMMNNLSRILPLHFNDDTLSTRKLVREVRGIARTGPAAGARREPDRRDQFVDARTGRGRRGRTGTDQKQRKRKSRLHRYADESAAFCPPDLPGTP
jgi:hypothetical protein